LSLFDMQFRGAIATCQSEKNGGQIGRRFRFFIDFLPRELEKHA